MSPARESTLCACCRADLTRASDNSTRLGQDGRPDGVGTAHTLTLTLPGSTECVYFSHVRTCCPERISLSSLTQWIFCHPAQQRCTVGNTCFHSQLTLLLLFSWALCEKRAPLSHFPWVLPIRAHVFQFVPLTQTSDQGDVISSK